MVKRISFLCSRANSLSPLGETKRGGKGGGGGQLLARFERDLRPPRATETAATGSKFDFNSENRTMFAHNIILPAHVFNALDRGDLINARLKTTRMIQKELSRQFRYNNLSIDDMI